MRSARFVIFQEALKREAPKKESNKKAPPKAGL
jgi:hypothetical protein